MSEDNTGSAVDFQVYRYDLMRKHAMDQIGVLEIKNAEYGDSWKRRGGANAFFMMARKWDRLETQVAKFHNDIFSAMEADTREEGIKDDIDDLINYLRLIRIEMMIRNREVTEEDARMARQLFAVDFATPVRRRSSRRDGMENPHGYNSEDDTETAPRKVFNWKNSSNGRRAILAMYIEARKDFQEQTLAYGEAGLGSNWCLVTVQNNVPQIFDEYEKQMGKPLEASILYDRFKKMWKGGERSTEHPWKNYALRKELQEGSSDYLKLYESYFQFEDINLADE